MKNPAEGWFKLLTVDEGEFYNVPVPPAGEDISEHLKKIQISQKPRSASEVHTVTDGNLQSRSHSLDKSKEPVSRLEDFNILKILGKGSFGE